MFIGYINFFTETSLMIEWSQKSPSLTEIVSVDLLKKIAQVVLIIAQFKINGCIYC